MSLKKALLLVVFGGAIVPAIGQQLELPGGHPAGLSTPTPPAATNNPSALQPGVAAAAAAAKPRPNVDESALRYFAQQGDTRRLEAEMARLRALYPDWTPPTDLFGAAAQTDTELQRMWQLYAEGKVSDARSAIAARQAADPSWTPPPELIARLNEAEARRQLINASDNGQWAMVLRVATETPALLTCSNVDVLWRVAEAFIKTDNAQRGQDAYAYVLNNCDDTGERVATVQKAMGLLDDARLAQLLKLERRGADGAGEFTALNIDLARRRVGRAAEDPSLSVSPEDVAALEKSAREGSDAGDALLLGWYLYRHGEPGKALDWFKIAVDRNGGAKAAEGYVLTLVSADRALEAEPIAYQWRDSSPENRKAYLDVVVSLLTADPPPKLAPEVLTHFSPIVTKDKYVSGAQALGWYAYNTGQVRTALDWFETAVSWAPDDEPSAYGLAVTLLRLREQRALAQVVARWRNSSERILALVNPEARRRLERKAAMEGTTSAVTPAYVRPGTPLEPSVATAVSRAETRRADNAPLPLSGTAPRRTPEEDYAAWSGKNPGNSGGGSGGSSGSGAAAALQGKRFSRCISLTDAGFRSGRLSGGEAATRGWCLLELDRPVEAVAAFDLAMKNGDEKTAQDAAYGKSLAYLRKGLTSAAQLASTEAPQNARRSAQLTTDILLQRALASYKDQRYVEVIIALDERARLVPEDQGLMMLRAWAYFHIRDLQSAERIFKALAATGNTEAQSGLTAILDFTKKNKY